MRAVAIVVLGVALAAGSALAGIPAGALSTSDAPVDKVGLAPTRTAALDCSGAVEVSLDGVYYGDNTGMPNNVDTYSCGYWWEPGGEVVYHLYLAEPAMWTATIEGSYCDLDLAVLDQCDADAGCIILVDATVTTEAPVSGDIYFVVDGYSEEGCPFTLTLTSLPMPPPVTFCDLTEAVTDYIFGDTCAGENLITSLPCSEVPEEGLEAYYEIVLPAGGGFVATVYGLQADPALWLLGTCEEPFDCLAYADAGLYGDPETIAYANSGSSDIVIYLVVDSYLAGSCGAFDLYYTYTPPTGVDATTWGGLKSLFK
jgi:hypothetical protein